MHTEATGGSVRRAHGLSSKRKNGDAITSSRNTLSRTSLVAKKIRKSSGRWQWTEKLPGGSR
jgi:hypothetical protein